MNTMPKLATHPAMIFGTAFAEGMAVLIVEIAGARVLAPYYGASLVVWTSQITATLLFLALGYLLGGWMSQRWSGWHLSALFAGAGLWLCVLPFIRNSLLESTAQSMGIAGGSFVSAAILFALPLTCFGAVSPVLIEHWSRLKTGAGGAAGLVYFINTLGGLAGAWLTSLVLIPHMPIRVMLLGLGVVLVCVSLVWYFLLANRGPAAPAAALIIALALSGASPGPMRAINYGNVQMQVLWSGQTHVGLVQVLDLPAKHSRTLIIDGITQGGINTLEGYSQYEFTEYLNFFSFAYHPDAKRALVLGMGSGALARQLAARGLEVTVIEIEPKIVEAARRWFGLPQEVKVIYGDGRASLPEAFGKFDLVFLDAFAGESVPWHLITREGVSELKEKLNPGGRLIVNTVTRPLGSAGLARLEAVLLDVFGEAVVYVEPSSSTGSGLVNATLVSGEALQWQVRQFPGKINPVFWNKIGALRGNQRAAVSGAPVATDEWSDLDFADAKLRSRWRELVIQGMDVRLLSD